MATWQDLPEKPGIHWVAPLTKDEADNEKFVDHPQFVFQPYAHMRGHTHALDADEWYFAANMYDQNNGRPLRGRMVCQVEAPPELSSGQG